MYVMIQLIEMHKGVTSHHIQFKIMLIHKCKDKDLRYYCIEYALPLIF